RDEVGEVLAADGEHVLAAGSTVEDHDVVVPVELVVHRHLLHRDGRVVEHPGPLVRTRAPGLPQWTTMVTRWDRAIAVCDRSRSAKRWESPGRRSVWVRPRWRFRACAPTASVVSRPSPETPWKSRSLPRSSWLSVP